MDKLSALFSYPKLKNYVGLLGKTPTFNNFRVGVEIELEHLNIQACPGTFSVEDDGSLRDYGKEFVSMPIKVQYLEVELERLYAGLLEFNASSRCSVHVHLNVRDITPQEVYKLVLLYCIFERSLYRYSGDRWDNIFCIPFRQIRFLKFLSYLRGGYIEVQNKYCGLNLSPICGTSESKKYGTIEFRHMEGGRSPKEIIEWINLLISLKIYAKKISTTDLEDHIRTMRTTSGYYWLVKEVFGKWSKLLTDQSTFKDDVEDCITNIKAQIKDF